jgi:hypothetical protein
MGEDGLFQICYEGDLTVEVSEALKRLGARPNFDQSWEVTMPRRSAATILRYLRMKIGGDARLMVAALDPRRSREYVLVRHSLTPGADYTELHGALERLGWVLELPFDATFIVETDDRTDARTLGAALTELCPDEALMVAGIAPDFAWCTAGLGSFAPGALAVGALARVRTI